MEKFRQLSDLSRKQRSDIITRDAGLDAVQEDVREILDSVKRDGDTALERLCKELDGVEIKKFDITEEAAEAATQLHPEVEAAIDTAAERIRSFHKKQVRDDWTESIDGVALGRRFRPIERVGAYVPGGTAAYPSTALMTVIPAKVAGVDQVAVVTPPAAEQNQITLAAIHKSGADEVYRIGGAQAIGALTYGTHSVDPVTKIVGPGNRWVTAAKAEVQGEVAIDMIAGPSEVLVLSDETAAPEYVASELLAQGEHDHHSSVAAVTISEDHARRILQAVEKQLPDRDRREIIEEALKNKASGVFVADSLSDAVDFAEEYAAEHLVIMTRDPQSVSERIDSAGSIFLGQYSPVAAGDYASGTNHVLPTSQKAKLIGGLSVDTFVRAVTVQHLSEESLLDLAQPIIKLAEIEGFEAHAESVKRRVKEE